MLISCENTEKNEDITNTVNKDGAIESAVKVEQLDSLRDVLITTHSVWKDNAIIKNMEYRDTVPSLGLKRTVAENADGDMKDITVKKEYEIYITVK
ncbi:MAG: hypothetical protein B7X72_08095 [Sphingobacteriia bacterium 39-39-8]|nr:MAG: hypothetical protein B7X72_08095 [Sphingobacteriia bacterium 39-39-8]